MWRYSLLSKFQGNGSILAEVMNIVIDALNVCGSGSLFTNPEPVTNGRFMSTASLPNDLVFAVYSVLSVLFLSSRALTHDIPNHLESCNDK